MFIKYCQKKQQQNFEDDIQMKTTHLEYLQKFFTIFVMNLKYIFLKNNDYDNLLNFFRFPSDIITLTIKVSE